MYIIFLHSDLISSVAYSNVILDVKSCKGVGIYNLIFVQLLCTFVYIKPNK